MSKNNSGILGISRLDKRSSGEPIESKSAAGNFDPPTSPTEVGLAKIWLSVLPDVKIQRSDNFIALGGDSLGLAQVIAEIDETYHVSLSLETLVHSLTLVDMAAAIDQLMSRD